MNADLLPPMQVLSLCSGYGGLEIGAKKVFNDVRTVAYVEIENYACANLVDKIQKGKMDDAPIWSDLKTFNAGNFRGHIDAIMGGYPCQPFSIAGNRKGEDDPRHLWPFIREIVNVIRPGICIFENVRGHVRLGLSTVLSELSELGYGVVAGIYSAREVGAPFEGERVFIFAKARGFRIEGRIRRETNGPIRFGWWNGEETRSKIVGRAKENRPADPEFLEWLMGLEQGWTALSTGTSGHIVSRVQLIGNGVVPLQAEHAIRDLIKKQIENERRKM